MAVAWREKGSDHTNVELGCSTEKPLKYGSDFDQQEWWKRVLGKEGTGEYIRVFQRMRINRMHVNM